MDELKNRGMVTFCRRRGRPEGLSRSDQCCVPANRDPDLHRASDSPLAGFRVLEGPHARVPALEAIYRAKGTEAGWKAFAEFEASSGSKIPATAAAQLGAHRTVLRLRSRASDDLHDERDRGAERCVGPFALQGHFSNDDAAMKLLYLLLNNAADEWKRRAARKV
jgi:hypothetical protein